jgi:hypothetical protein
MECSAICSSRPADWGIVGCRQRTRAQDVLVVTAPGSGAEIIPFLKTWVNLPMAIAFTVGYAKVWGRQQRWARGGRAANPFSQSFQALASAHMPRAARRHALQHDVCVLL